MRLGGSGERGTTGPEWGLLWPSGRMSPAPVANGEVARASRLSLMPAPTCADEKSEGRTGRVLPPQGRGKQEDANRPGEMPFVDRTDLPACLTDCRAWKKSICCKLGGGAQVAGDGLARHEGLTTTPPPIVSRLSTRA